MKNYEREYHTLMHRELLNNEKYYKVRAELAIKKYFGDLSNEKVLDFGCGLGQNIYLIKNSVGYDISKFGVEFCKRKGIATVDDLNKLEDESFDIVFSSHALEHVENPSNTLYLMKRKLKKDGKLILILPVEKHIKRHDFNMAKNQHLYSWTFKTINNLLIKNCFKIVENKYLRGSGYKKLLIFSFNLKLYSFLTWITGFLKREKEMKIIAIKI